MVAAKSVISPVALICNLLSLPVWLPKNKWSLYIAQQADLRGISLIVTEGDAPWAVRVSVATSVSVPAATVAIVNSPSLVPPVLPDTSILSPAVKPPNPLLLSVIVSGLLFTNAIVVSVTVFPASFAKFAPPSMSLNFWT